MDEFTKHTKTRDNLIDGVGPWMWRELDDGAWQGPHQEWMNTHKTAYLKYVKKFDCCVQAGGNHGLYPRLLAEHFKLVYTFEPDAKNFHCLVNNCQLESIIKIQGALGEVSGLTGISNTDETNTGTYRIDPQGGSVPIFTIDSFNFTQLDLIQLDVEGYEPRVLAGAIETIKRLRPVIACEITDGGVLSSLGYRLIESVGADRIYVPD